MSERLTDFDVANQLVLYGEVGSMDFDPDVLALAREVQEYRALRPTCPTCNGTCVATRALMPVTPSTCIHCEQTITLHGNSRWYHTGGWECCRLGSPSSPVATPPIVEGDVPCPDCTDGKIPLDKWVALQGDVAKSIDQLLNGHTITERLAEGWYPSGRDPDTGEVQHDRHVLIWLRNYEELLRKASAVLKMAGVT